MDIDQFPESKSAQEMLNMVTKGWYDRSYVGKWLYQVMGQEIDDAKQLLEELPLQVFPETATWGLMYHEQKYNLPIKKELSLTERRQAVLFKRSLKLPLNPFRLETFVTEFTGCRTNVDDVNCNPGTFFVRLFPERGKKINFKQLVERVTDMKPSHLMALYQCIWKENKRTYLYIGGGHVNHIRVTFHPWPVSSHKEIKIKMEADVKRIEHMSVTYTPKWEGENRWIREL